MQHLRREYTKLSLSESTTCPDPLDLFRIWFQEAVNAGITEPNAMVLATASPDNMPSVRMVLLKDVVNGAFVFFTNYDSRKGIHLSTNPNASLLFYWSGLERQVRIEGKVERTAESYSDDYFKSRPTESRVGAIVSRQSAVIPSRDSFEEKFYDYIQSGRDSVSRPAYWGGYLLRPVLIEFWQGREHRLHDRIQYRMKDTGWIMERLAP